MKDTLFDIGEKPSRARREPEEFKPKVAIYKAASAEMLGRSDDKYECADGGCDSKTHDIVMCSDDGRRWFLQCVFCGVGQWVKAEQQPVAADEDEFRLKDGRYSGLTPAQIDGISGGRGYLEWAAESHPRQSVRAAVKKYLDRAGVGS